MRNRTIQYAVDTEGHVASRVDSEIAFPVLEYDKMTPENNYKMTYKLEKEGVLHICRTDWFKGLKWTRKIPVQIKNYHREFWGFCPLVDKNRRQREGIPS